MAVEKIQPMRKRFAKLTLRTKSITPSERALEIVPKMVSEVLCIFALGHFGFWKDVHLNLQQVNASIKILRVLQNRPIVLIISQRNDICDSHPQTHTRVILAKSLNLVSPRSHLYE